jgi:hypothetical protein
MIKQFRFSLRAGSKKDVCPQCKKKSFVPYVDENGKEAGENFGRCERVNNCGYLQYPKEKGEKIEYVEPIREIPKPTDFIDLKTVQSTFCDFNSNIFLMYLAVKFGSEKALELQSSYNIGTAKQGGTIFWQQDFNGQFRTGKVMYYQPNGKRNKDRMSWYVHSKIKKDYVLKQVFFGEHLLKEFPDKPVALCESEKTAVIMSVLRPQYIWLASGGSEMLNADRFYYLYGRNLTVFPDEGQFKKWSDKTAFIKDRIMNTEVESEFLKGNCENGSDILDIIKY